MLHLTFFDNEREEKTYHKSEHDLGASLCIYIKQSMVTPQRIKRDSRIEGAFPKLLSSK